MAQNKINKKNIDKQVKPKKGFKFGYVLAIVSIIGFLQLVLKSFFDLSTNHYDGFFLLTIIGIGFIIQSKPKKIFNYSTDEAVSDITSLVIGCLSVISGILSLPFITVNHPIVEAVPGIIAIIAIIFITLETWVIKQK